MIDPNNMKNIKVITTVQNYSMRHKIEEIVSKFDENYEVEKKSDYVYYGGYAIIWYADFDDLKLFSHAIQKLGYKNSLFSGKTKVDDGNYKLKIIHIEDGSKENTYA